MQSTILAITIFSDDSSESAVMNLTIARDGESLEMMKNGGDERRRWEKMEVAGIHGGSQNFIYYFIPFSPTITTIFSGNPPISIKTQTQNPKPISIKTQTIFSGHHHHRKTTYRITTRLFDEEREWVGKKKKKKKKRF